MAILAKMQKRHEGKSEREGVVATPSVLRERVNRNKCLLTVASSAVAKIILERAIVNVYKYRIILGKCKPIWKLIIWFYFTFFVITTCIISLFSLFHEIG